MTETANSGELTVGQTVVTDPGSGRSSGYVLLAASPSVSAADAQHLTRVPQVTDFLHTEESPGTFFSFYRLPSGAWAVVKRFVAGRRRGAFNRVVVYSWVVPEPVLAAVVDEPWLLLTACRFRPFDRSRTLNPADLGKEAASLELHRLADLECRPPSAPEVERAAVLRRRRDVLLKAFDVHQLESLLADVYAALAAGQRVLLPAGRSFQQLLLLAWSSLPAADRLETPWTTHLAAATGSLFRLANLPASHAGRVDRQDWCRPPEDRPPEDAGGGAPALAAAVAGGLLPDAAADADFRRHQIRLPTAGARVRRRLARLRRGDTLRLEALPDPSTLVTFLDDFRLTRGDEQVEPELDPSDVLTWACAGVLHSTEAGKSLETAVVQVYGALEKSFWGPRLLSPERVARYSRSPPETLGPRAIPVAVALALERAETIESRERLLAVLLEARADLATAEARPLFTPVLATLGLDLARRGSRSQRPAVDALAEIPGGLEAAQSMLGAAPRPEDLPAVAALIEASRGTHQPALAAELAGCLTRLLADRPELSAGIAASGLAEGLAAMELPPDVWLPLALVEADAVDSPTSPTGRFLDRLRLDDLSSAEQVLARVRERARAGTLGEGHRLLIQGVAAGLSRLPEQTAEALGQLDGLSDGDFLRWGETLADLAAALQQAGARRPASALCRTWLVQLATRSWTELPLATQRLFSGLVGEDRRTVVDLWLPRVSGLGHKLGEDEFVKALQPLARELPEDRFKLSVQLLARQTATRQTTLEQAVKRADRMARHHDYWQPWLIQAVRLLVPKEPRARAEAVLGLLLARGLSPATRKVIDAELCRHALRNAGAKLAQVVPPVSEFRGQGHLLLRVARELGRVWSGDVENVERFLRDAAYAERWDAVEAFLDVAERGPNSFLKDLALAGDPTLFRLIREGARRAPALRPYVTELGRLERTFEKRTA